MKKKYSFEAYAEEIESQYAGLEKVAVWSDGLSIKSEWERGWTPAYRFVPGKRYRITIERIEG
jgi:hypothetical protein